MTLLHKTMPHRFVEFIPDQLEPGTLFVSVKFATAVHACACGCGSEVVTPLTPTEWSMIFDGATVSLHPSIGNWNLPCRSHYFIRKGKVLEARPWTDRQIDAEHRRAKASRQDHFDSQFSDAPPLTDDAPKPPKKKRGFWSWLGGER